MFLSLSLVFCVVSYANGGKRCLFIHLFIGRGNVPTNIIKHEMLGDCTSINFVSLSSCFGIDSDANGDKRCLFVYSFIFRRGNVLTKVMKHKIRNFTP